jgi:hypothetical protein
MKTQKKNCHGLYLQKNNRWKWIAGATTAAAAGVGASQASTITINLLNNYISVSGGNHLNADLTGDGHPDLTITNAFNGGSYRGDHGYFSFVGVNLNGVRAYALFGNYDRVGVVSLGSQRIGFYLGSVYSGYATSHLVGWIPIFFKDLHINDGAPTKGALEVTVSGTNPKIQLDSLTYNTPGQGSRLGLAVPDRGSSLALLAMGAGGVLALRRWKAVQERS